MKKTLALLIIGLGIGAEAQIPAAPVITTRGTFFALSVANMDSSVKWYREKLGLSVAIQVPRSDPTKSAMTLLQGGGLTVELVQHDESVPLRNFLPEPKGALFVHGIFKVGVVVDDFDATLAAIRARGIDVAIGPFPRSADQPANAIIRDNAGNYIQLFGR
jgi:catechol 2,3-dioxygenase-like lactoylglutathione lyase family enzyme